MIDGVLDTWATGSGAAPPVAIGGIGGSGTRLVASLLSDLGFFIGSDLNPASDNLWFTLLFKRREILELGDSGFAELVAIFRGAMTAPAPLGPAALASVHALAARDRPAHDREWLRQRARSLVQWSAERHALPRAWGWKEPNTHVVLPRLAPRLPGLKYIHVVRNGLDMAYSDNQDQLRLWGPHFLELEDIEVTPRLSLKYWRAVHQRVLAEGERLGARFLWLNYDDFCATPDAGLSTLLHFLGVESNSGLRDQLRARVRPPPSLGRFRSQPASDFDAEDVAFAAELGFDTRYDETGMAPAGSR